MPNIDLSIVIVSWNVWDLLRAALQSIEAVSRLAPGKAATQRLFGPPDQQHLLEVIVVDNASDDATADLLPSRFPWVRLIRSEENLGFTAGNNRGYAGIDRQPRLFLESRHRACPRQGGG